MSNVKDTLKRFIFRDEFSQQLRDKAFSLLANFHTEDYVDVSSYLLKASDLLDKIQAEEEINRLNLREGEKLFLIDRKAYEKAR